MAAKNNKILYSVANNSDGKLVNAKDAVKGRTFTCPVCNNYLILRKSGNTGRNSKRPHFAHKTLTQNCTPETALHYIFKTQAYEKINKLLLAKQSLKFRWICQFCTEKHQGNLLKKISEVKLEYNLGKCQPDSII